MCEWQSITPGERCSPLPSISSVPAGASTLPTAAILPALTYTSPANAGDTAVWMVTLRITHVPPVWSAGLRCASVSNG